MIIHLQHLLASWADPSVHTSYIDDSYVRTYTYLLLGGPNWKIIAYFNANILCYIHVGTFTIGWLWNYLHIFFHIVFPVQVFILEGFFFV